MKVLIGIDDTDNKESRGTGFLSRQMGKQISDTKLGFVEGITRHQLFVHKDIPYTSQNSSACLLVETEKIDLLTSFCRNFLLENAALGSDVGLCVANFNIVSKRVCDWGKSAKNTVLSMQAAMNMAAEEQIFLEGLTGTNIGVIGALAGVGLRKDGNDGRFIWLMGKEIRDMNGIMKASEILSFSGINKIECLNGTSPEPNDYILLGDWV
ncbi:MAG: hypothetical protein JXR58_13375, partial [Bacteroidales bacterium]|nr:hypothetical protein [Bacteroidales bacterium]